MTPCQSLRTTLLAERSSSITFDYHHDKHEVLYMELRRLERVASREVVQHDLSTTTTTSTRCCTCRDSPRKPDNGTISTLHCPRFCKRLLVPFSS